MSVEIEALQRRLVDAYREIGVLKQAEGEQAGYYGDIIHTQAARIREMEAENKQLIEKVGKYRKRTQANELRINELYAKIGNLERLQNDLKCNCNTLLSRAQKAEAKIVELEGWLVEERISGEFSDWIENQCPHWDIDDESFCSALDGPCEYNEGKCPIRDELRGRARQQLISEGKLMPADKSAQPAAMSSCRMMLTEEQLVAIQAAEIEFRQPNSWLEESRIKIHEVLHDMLSSPSAWEVTEERTAALGELIEHCRLAGNPDTSVLRAMLEEARQ